MSEQTEKEALEHEQRQIRGRLSAAVVELEAALTHNQELKRSLLDALERAQRAEQERDAARKANEAVYDAARIEYQIDHTRLLEAVDLTVGRLRDQAALIVGQFGYEGIADWMRIEADDLEAALSPKALEARSRALVEALTACQGDAYLGLLIAGENDERELAPDDALRSINDTARKAIRAFNNQPTGTEGGADA